MIFALELNTSYECCPNSELANSSLSLCYHAILYILHKCGYTYSHQSGAQCKCVLSPYLFEKCVTEICIILFHILKY